MRQGEIIAMLMTFVVHVIGIAYLLVRVLSGGGSFRSFLDGWWPRFDDGSGGNSPQPSPKPDSLPLPYGVPARKRLRPSVRVVRKRSRRPDHSPLPPARKPVELPK